MTDDIVAELDCWLRAGYFTSDHPAYQSMERARDEIVALRKCMKASDVEVLIEIGCAEQRERDARVAESGGFIQATDTEWDEGVNYARRFIAAAIRNQGDKT